MLIIFPLIFTLTLGLVPKKSGKLITSTGNKDSYSNAFSQLQDGELKVITPETNSNELDLSLCLGRNRAVHSSEHDSTLSRDHISKKVKMVVPEAPYSDYSATHWNQEGVEHAPISREWNEQHWNKKQPINYNFDPQQLFAIVGNKEFLPVIPGPQWSEFEKRNKRKFSNHHLRYVDDDNHQLEPSWYIQVPIFNRRLDSDPKINKEFADNSTPAQDTSARTARFRKGKIQITSAHEKGKDKKSSKEIHDIPVESEASREFSKEIMHSIKPAIQADERSKEPIKVLHVSQLCHALWKKLDLFEPNIVGASPHRKHLSIHVCLELLGMEILDEIGECSKKYGYQKTLELKNLRINMRSHSIKSIVSYIHLINVVSDLPLFPNSEQLRNAQKRAVLYMNYFWNQYDINEKQKDSKNGISSPNFSAFFSSPIEEARFQIAQKDTNFNFTKRCQVANSLFLMWMRDALPDIYQQIRASNFELRWKPWVIAILHVQLLSLKSSQEIGDAINNFAHKEASSFHFDYDKYFTYHIKQPFKINWTRHDK